MTTARGQSAARAGAGGAASPRRGPPILRCLAPPPRSVLALGLPDEAWPKRAGCDVRRPGAACARRREDPSLSSASRSSPWDWVRSGTPPGANHRCSGRGVGRGRPKCCL